MHRTAEHIGIIPDGNRRWAQRNGMDKADGYVYGLESGIRLLRAAKECGIKELTFYGFTVDNCKRPKRQVEAFSDACVSAVKLIEKEDVTVGVTGNADSPCFPKALLGYANRERAQNKMKVNLLVNYGWEWDLKNGWASRGIPRIDMVIRWGGMCRLSGFLPIQTVYSDILVIDDLWPDFKEEHFRNALKWYLKQDVTLGG